MRIQIFGGLQVYMCALQSSEELDFRGFALMWEVIAPSAGLPKYLRKPLLILRASLIPILYEPRSRDEVMLGSDKGAKKPPTAFQLIALRSLKARSQRI